MDLLPKQAILLRVVPSVKLDDPVKCTICFTPLNINKMFICRGLFHLKALSGVA